jgi:hypothetical protein
VLPDQRQRMGESGRQPGKIRRVLVSRGQRRNWETGSLDEWINVRRLIVACKAARLYWSTTSMIIRNWPGCSLHLSRCLTTAKRYLKLCYCQRRNERFGSGRFQALRRGMIRSRLLFPYFKSDLSSSGSRLWMGAVRRPAPSGYNA